MDEKIKKLTELIKKAAEQSYNEVITKNPNDNFFAFVLSTLDDANYISANINSEENHLKILKKYNTDPDSPDAEYFRWSPNEWGDYEHISQDFFKDVDKYLEKLFDELDYGQFKNRIFYVLEAMESALKELDYSGFCGSRREKITLYITIIDSLLTKNVEDKSAKSLNNPAIYERFKNRYKKTEMLIQEKEQKKTDFISKVALKKSSKEQVKFWLEQIYLYVTGKNNELKNTGFDEKTGIESLIKLGNIAVLPVLDFVESIIQEEERLIDTLRFNLIMAIRKISYKNAKVHRKLAKLLKLSCKLNEGREKWQTTPFHVAACLNDLFDGYPKPSMAGNNALEEYKTFIKISQKHAGWF